MWTATTGIHTNSFLLEPVYGYQIRSSYSYQCECTLMPVKLGHMTDCIDSVDEPLTNATNKSCPAWAQEHCRIRPSRFLAKCRNRQLNQGSFVLLYLAPFELYSVLFSCMVLFRQYQTSDWLWRLPPKWPRLCQVGRYNSNQRTNPGTKLSSFNCCIVL